MSAQRAVGGILTLQHAPPPTNPPQSGLRTQVIVGTWREFHGFASLPCRLANRQPLPRSLTQGGGYWVASSLRLLGEPALSTD